MRDRLGGVKRAYLIGVMVLGLGLVGCEKKIGGDNGVPPAERLVTQQQIAGKFRLVVDEEMTEEMGGVEELPTLFLNSAGKFRLVSAGVPDAVGEYTVKAGEVTLSVDGEETQVYFIEDKGMTLVEDGGEMPLTWGKVVEEGSE